MLVPADGVALGKLAQSLAYGARTLLVRGDFDDCLRLVEEASAKLGVYLLNSVNPFRLEGQKTIVLELLQQLGWEPPDWIVLPAGNLGNTAAFGKALREARAWGLIDRLPRLAAVQAEGAAPFARGYAEGFTTRHRVKAETVATAIKIGDPASWDRAVRAIRETDGVVLTASDAEILEAKAAVDAAGIGCEPASAASVAGVRKLVRSRMVAAVGPGRRGPYRARAEGSGDAAPVSPRTWTRRPRAPIGRSRSSPTCGRSSRAVTERSGDSSVGPAARSHLAGRGGEREIRRRSPTAGPSPCVLGADP